MILTTTARLDCNLRARQGSLTYLTHTPLSQITRNEPKDGEKRKKKKDPKKKKRVEKQRAKGRNKKGEREQRLPLH